MATTHVELVTPQRNLFSGEADMVTCRTEGGDIAFLADHMPYLGVLEPCVVRIIAEGGGETRMAAHGGFVEVHHNRVTILADVAEPADDIDLARAQRAREEAERAVAAGNDPEAEAALRRAQARVEAAGG
ncbi:MAG: ATP synthase F1 subunit epsilon [Acidimicrobiales bacterium]